MFPESEHRNCARHIYANWHKTHNGEELKLLFWSAAKAYNQADYKDALDAMKLISARAVEDFVSQNSRAFVGLLLTRLLNVKLLSTILLKPLMHILCKRGLSTLYICWRILGLP